MHWLLELATAVTWLSPELSWLVRKSCKNKAEGAKKKKKRAFYLQGHVRLWFPFSPSAATTFLHWAPSLRGGEKRGVDGSVPGLIWRRILDATWVWIVNVAFSWALFGKEAWWRHLRSDRLGERRGVITLRRREGRLMPSPSYEKKSLNHTENTSFFIFIFF